jgi:hypothetical protein
VLIQHFAAPEIANSDLPVIVHQDILGFQVAMRNILPVDVPEPQ